MSATAEALSNRIDGDVIGRDGTGYDEARKVFNAMVDKRPAAIVRCASTEDVVAAIDFARSNDLVIAVRSGGHSVAGMSICDDGIVIDLAALNRVEVDPDARIARAGGGVLWGEFDKATQAHALHTPGGRVTTTGVGGFSLGGGYGWTSSKHGLTSDNLVAAQLVTADGRILTASEDENVELFWGLRGGGGNFGVVTRFDFRLHELGPTVLAGLALWPIDRLGEVMRGWRDYVEAAPDELSSACVALTAPPEEFVPEEMRGRPAAAVAAMYVGDPDDGAPVIQPLKDLGPTVDLIQPMPYVDFQAILDPSAPPGYRNYWRGEYLAGLSDGAIDAFVEHAEKPLSAETPFTQVVMFRLGGGLTRVPDEATAFSHRDAEYMFHPISVWEDPGDDERHIGINRRFSEAMRPFATGASYLNFTAERDRVREAFGPEKYERLVKLKDEYDPENRFQHNQNIRPSRDAGEPVSS